MNSFDVLMMEYQTLIRKSHLNVIKLLNNIKFFENGSCTATKERRSFYLCACYGCSVADWCGGVCTLWQPRSGAGWRASSAAHNTSAQL